jgi:CO dehydrogenase maturation factor
MGYTIAIAGKGGTGKTTIAALIIRLIKEKKLGSVLGVDADPNSNLGEALGFKPEQTIGRVLDEISAHPEKIPAGMTKDRFIEYQVQTIIQEGDGFDLLTMGKPEGPGCYCYVNNVLRNQMGKTIKDYDFVVIDNEAGLEHLSRKTTASCDALVVISDATVAGLRAAFRISELVADLKIKAKKKLLLVNRFTRNIAQGKIKNSGLDYAGHIPEDKTIERASADGRALWGLKNNSAAFKALDNLFKKIL